MSQVDGDTDNVSVQHEFERVIRQHTIRLGHTAAYKIQPPQQPQQQSRIASSADRRSADATRLQHDTIDLEDLDNVPGTVPTISNHISLIQNKNNTGSNEPDNNNLNNNYANHVNKTNNITNNTSSKHNNNNHTDANGILPAGAAAAANRSKTFRSMLEEAETYPIDL